ncbi:hypothetical protein Hypma_002843 [Hypsizygus marmoreus]|uniref:Uncharacterized protein n=1 Tax=Hypsizygus marmoreus TaxID=39966 RepID=A0A369J3R5_HYPMA|nr:hypothetical protein Hypma_002843 [Hypsizygus marmoreus]
MNVDGSPPEALAGISDQSLGLMDAERQMMSGVGGCRWRGYGWRWGCEAQMSSRNQELEIRVGSIYMVDCEGKTSHIWCLCEERGYLALPQSCSLLSSSLKARSPSSKGSVPPSDIIPALSVYNMSLNSQ